MILNSYLIHLNFKDKISVMKKITFLMLTIFSVAFIFAQPTITNKEISSVKLKTLDGKEIDLKNYIKADRITVISFWATWCSPCKKELDNINDLVDDWKKKYNVDVIAISIDNSKDAQKVKPFVDGKNWDFGVLLDVNSDCKRVFNFNTVPFTVLIDKNKQIVYRHSGYVEGDESHLEQEIKKLK
jgi:cytochrome c biogenesis protein CcmG, thiol:disulfide interchange protein DsbE